MTQTEIDEGLSAAWEQFVRECGSTLCVDCHEQFTEDKPCCCSDGVLGNGETQCQETDLQVNGRCIVCCPKNRHPKEIYSWE
jgi:hypothetical protein